MNIIETPIEGLLIVEPRIFEDSRGYFFESFSQREFDEVVGRTVFFVIYCRIKRVQQTQKCNIL